MSEKQSDIFDDKFKDAADQYQPDFDEASWSKMEAKLDAENRRKPLAWLWWLTDGLMIGMMIFIAATVYHVHQNQRATPGTENQATATEIPVDKNAVTNTQQEQAAVAKVVKEDEPAKEAVAVHTQKEAGLSTTHTRSNSTGHLGEKTYAFPESKLSIGDPIQNNNTGKPGIGIAETASPLTNDSTTEKAITHSSSLIENKQVTGEENSVTPENPVAANIDNDSLVDQQPAKEAVTGTNNSGLKPAITKPNNKRSNRFFLHGEAAPEWSFIPGRTLGPLTLNIGGGVGFNLDKKWSIQAGVYASKKNYKAGPADYKAKPGTYYYNLTIYHIDAYCNILEIPVSINYKLLNHKKESLIASAGFASLLMSKETYHYDYQRASGVPGYAVHTYKTGTFHPFAGALLSLGYQLKLNQKLSVSATPYLKVPLYGVGEGRVKIGSTGLAIGVQYQLPAFK